MSYSNQHANSIRVLKPYKWNTLWVFDDAETGLVREAFVSGIDDMLDVITRDIPNAEKGFLLMFSDTEFPKATVRLDWVRQGSKGLGNWYRCAQLGIEGWLCPALFHYFDKAPESIHAAFLPLTKTTK